MTDWYVQIDSDDENDGKWLHVRDAGDFCIKQTRKGYPIGEVDYIGGLEVFDDVR